MDVRRVEQRTALSLAMSHKAEELIVGADDNTVQVWNWRNGTHPENVLHTSYRMSCMAVSKDGCRFAWSARNTVYVWEPHQQARQQRTQAHAYDVSSVGFLEGGVYVRTFGDEYGLRDESGSIHAGVGYGPLMDQYRVWDVDSGICLCQMPGPSRLARSQESAGEWFLKVTDDETTVCLGRPTDTVAWYPHNVENVDLHPSLPIWAARTTEGSSFALFSIEPLEAFHRSSEPPETAPSVDNPPSYSKTAPVPLQKDVGKSSIHLGLLAPLTPIESDTGVPWGVPLGTVIRGPFLPWLDHPDYEFFGRTEPRAPVTGDFFGIIRSPGTYRAIAVADASGWGPKAAEVMVATVPLLVSAIRMHPQHPGKVLREIDVRLEPILRNSARFVCLTLAILDLATDEVRIANAGHHSSLLLDGDRGVVEIEEDLEDAGPPLGVIGDFPYSESALCLMPGQRLRCSPTASLNKSTPTATCILFSESLNSYQSRTGMQLTSASSCSKTTARTQAPMSVMMIGRWYSSDGSLPASKIANSHDDTTLHLWNDRTLEKTLAPYPHTTGRTFSFLAD